MRRREFITLIGAATVTFPLVARAQQRGMPVIGFLSSGSPIVSKKYLAAFLDGLRSREFVEGKNVAIEYRWANGNYDQLPPLAAELVNLGVAVILASGGTASAIAAKNATSTIPIVSTGMPDPIERGLVASLNRPGGNVTGVSLLTTEVVSKRFELLSTLVPNVEAFGLLVNPKSPVHADEVKAAHRAAAALGKSLIWLNASSESDFEPAFDSFIAQGCGALILSVDSYFLNHRDQLIALAARHRIPTMYGWPEFPRAGGLASYGPDLSEQYRLGGVYVGRILKGEKPQDLPVVQPTKLNFLLNLKTMKALNIEAPAKILALPDEVIE